MLIFLLTDDLAVFLQWFMKFLKDLVNKWHRQLLVKRKERGKNADCMAFFHFLRIIYVFHEVLRHHLKNTSIQQGFSLQIEFRLESHVLKYIDDSVTQSNVG